METFGTIEPKTKRTRKPKTAKVISIGESPEEIKPKISLPKVDYSREPGHMKESYWIWGDGRKTHLRYMRDALIVGKKFPPGFYKAIEKGNNASMKHLCKVAKDRGIEELE